MLFCNEFCKHAVLILVVVFIQALVTSSENSDKSRLSRVLGELEGSLGEIQSYIEDVKERANEEQELKMLEARRAIKWQEPPRPARNQLETSGTGGGAQINTNSDEESSKIDREHDIDGGRREILKLLRSLIAKEREEEISQTAGKTRP